MPPPVHVLNLPKSERGYKTPRLVLDNNLRLSRPVVTNPRCPWDGLGVGVRVVRSQHSEPGDRVGVRVCLFQV